MGNVGMAVCSLAESWSRLDGCNGQQFVNFRAIAGSRHADGAFQLAACCGAFVRFWQDIAGLSNFKHHLWTAGTTCCLASSQGAGTCNWQLAVFAAAS